MRIYVRCIIAATRDGRTRGGAGNPKGGVRKSSASAPGSAELLGEVGVKSCRGDWAGVMDGHFFLVLGSCLITSKGKHITTRARRIHFSADAYHLIPTPGCKQTENYTHDGSNSKVGYRRYVSPFCFRRLHLGEITFTA